jgi:RNA polymerase sigma-70 factor (ECF subfamily)
LDHANAARLTEVSAIEPSNAHTVMESSDDHELVTAAKRGDKQAFGILVRRHQRRLYRVALHLLRDSNEAEDVTQDAFVRAYAALGRFDGRSQPYTWFYRIAVNLSLNRLRSRKRAVATSDIDDSRLDAFVADSRPSASPHRRATGHQLGQALSEAVDALSETLKTTLVLVVMEGVPQNEAAQILGCPEGTIAWRIHEARKKIRSALVTGGHLEEGEIT